jgi:hypothetical protein
LAPQIGHNPQGDMDSVALSMEEFQSSQNDHEKRNKDKQEVIHSKETLQGNNFTL